MVLVLGAHPDDIELGCGATISTMKDKVGFCFTVNSAFKKMLPEMLKSWELLNIKYLPDWDQNFTHRELNRQHVLDVLIRLRKEFCPKIVFTHSSFDHHQDHKVIYEESVRAFKHSTVLGYDLAWNNVKGADFRYYNSVSLKEVNTKLEALRCYESQSHRTYFDPEYQRSQMFCNGQQKDLMFAERFELISYVNN